MSEIGMCQVGSCTRPAFRSLLVEANLDMPELLSYKARLNLCDHHYDLLAEVPPVSARTAPASDSETVGHAQQPPVMYPLVKWAMAEKPQVTDLPGEVF